MCVNLNVYFALQRTVECVLLIEDNAEARRVMGGQNQPANTREVHVYCCRFMIRNVDSFGQKKMSMSSQRLKWKLDKC